jgi:hypothetical protein
MYFERLREEDKRTIIRREALIQSQKAKRHSDRYH